MDGVGGEDRMTMVVVEMGVVYVARKTWVVEEMCVLDGVWCKWRREGDLGCGGDVCAGWCPV